MGAFVGAASASFSLFLTGTFDLQTTPEEDLEIGEPLAEVVAMLPAPIAKNVGKASPFVKLGRAVGKVVVKRMAMVKANQAARRPAPVAAGTPAPVAPTVVPPPFTNAPDPGRVPQNNGAVYVPPGEVFAPMPMDVGG
jgi:hypothetical protein